ncbi:MAG: copper homeostasis protein CutC [Acidobacteriota bacterium]
MASERVRVEICLDSVSGALAAEKGGADRIELCADLAEGGITPSLGMIEQASASTSIDLRVMIRPRGQDFLYDRHELRIMERDIEHVRELAESVPGIRGVVFGVLRADGLLDSSALRRLIDAARPLEVTCHRAFDLCAEPFRALDDLIELGVERVLTSGQAASAPAGAERLAELVEQAGDEIIVLPGAGITPRNAAALVARTGVREIHATAWKRHESSMSFRRNEPFMGAVDAAEYEWNVVDPELVAALVGAVR